ncbi:MAG: L-threonylcarbamoyladenylate synthase [Dehalococcoidales bacterium]
MQKLAGNSEGLKERIGEAVKILLTGGIVAFPTDTVYGLGACCYLEGAVKRIYAIKERPSGMALPLLLSSPGQIGEVADSVPEVARLLIENFLPGALTIILNKKSTIPAFVTGGGTTVAVRVPRHPVPVALARGVGAPISGTSANISGRPSLFTAEEVRGEIGDRLDMIIDAGRCPGGRESTVVDVTGNRPAIIREGAIDFAALKEVCGDIILERGD